MSVAKHFYIVTSHLRFLGKPSVWGSRPWSSPTPSPSSFSSAPPLPSSSTVSWLLGGVLFPYQPPWRPAPRLRWEVLWRPSWWPDDCLCSLSTLSPRATGKKSCRSFLPSRFPRGLLPPSVRLSVRELVPLKFFSFFLEEKKPCCSFHNGRSLPQHQIQQYWSRSRSSGVTISQPEDPDSIRLFETTTVLRFFGPVLSDLRFPWSQNHKQMQLKGICR